MGKVTGKHTRWPSCPPHSPLPSAAPSAQRPHAQIVSCPRSSHHPHPPSQSRYCCPPQNLDKRHTQSKSYTNMLQSDVTESDVLRTPGLRALRLVYGTGTQESRGQCVSRHLISAVTIQQSAYLPIGTYSSSCCALHIAIGPASILPVDGALPTTELSDPKRTVS